MGEDDVSHVHDKSFCSVNSLYQVAIPKRKRCPLACPYSQHLPGDRCHKVCVTAGKCATFHPSRSFANKKTKKCIPACGLKEHQRVVGCFQCAKVGICVECLPGFTLVDNGKRCK